MFLYSIDYEGFMNCKLVFFLVGRLGTCIHYFFLKSVLQTKKAA